MRLDAAVHARTPSLSRSFAHKLIKDGKVAINQQVITQPSYKVGEKDKIIVDYQQVKIPKISLEIIYQDDDCVVINKPDGLLSHSKGGYNPEPTVATWLTNEYYDTLSRFPRTVLGDRGGIVHRLDRATSGVMICAKTPDAFEWLQKQFSSRKVIKTYYALVEGVVEPRAAIIDAPIERNPKSPQRFHVNHTGKTAQTTYKVMKHFRRDDRDYSLIELTPKTGRTHQLRVHLNYLKKPILGDTFYDGAKADRLYLHAAKLEITLPNKQRQIFESTLPPDFLKPKAL